MLQCPFNSSHLVKKSRFNNHLIQCRAQHPDKNLNFCIFNDTHLFDPEDAMEHFSTCPDRIPHSELFALLSKRRYIQKEGDKILDLDCEPNTFIPIKNSRDCTVSTSPTLQFQALELKSSDFASAREKIADDASCASSNACKSITTSIPAIANARKAIEANGTCRGSVIDSFHTPRSRLTLRSSVNSAFKNYRRTQCVDSDNASFVTANSESEADSIIWDLVKLKKMYP